MLLCIETNFSIHLLWTCAIIKRVPYGTVCFILNFPNLVRSLMRKTKLHKDPRHKRSCLFYPPYFGTEAVEPNFVACTCTARCGSKQITLATTNNLTKPLIHWAISKTTMLSKHKNEIIAAGKKKVETPRLIGCWTKGLLH